MIRQLTISSRQFNSSYQDRQSFIIWELLIENGGQIDAAIENYKKTVELDQHDKNAHGTWVWSIY